MRQLSNRLALGLTIGLAAMAQVWAANTPASDSPVTGNDVKQVEVTADQSLEWYQDKHMYVARGNAKAVRGDLTVEADLLSAHERDKPDAANGDKTAKPPKTATSSDNTPGGGDIDKMTAEGNVRITSPKSRVTGDHAVDDMDKHIMVVTGNNLKYETDKETVTARDSLEYWDEKKIAVARGHAVAIQPDKHVEADILTAEFRDAPNGSTQLDKMTAVGHVTVITKSNVSRGDRAVYDTSRNIAIISGNVRITRDDGTQLTGDVGEVDFATNQSRLMNEGSGRVRALLPSKSTDKSVGGTASKSSTKSSAMPQVMSVSTGVSP